MTLPVIYRSLSKLTFLLNKYDALNQIIKCLHQIISENKPYNLGLCTFTLHKFQKKNLNLKQDLNSDLQISSLALCHWAIQFFITWSLSHDKRDFSLKDAVINWKKSHENTLWSDTAFTKCVRWWFRRSEGRGESSGINTGSVLSILTFMKSLLLYFVLPSDLVTITILCYL